MRPAASPVNGYHSTLSGKTSDCDATHFRPVEPFPAALPAGHLCPAHTAILHRLRRASLIMKKLEPTTVLILLIANTLSAAEIVQDRWSGGSLFYASEYLGQTFLADDLVDHGSTEDPILKTISVDLVVMNPSWDWDRSVTLSLFEGRGFPVPGVTLPLALREINPVAGGEWNSHHWTEFDMDLALHPGNTYSFVIQSPTPQPGVAGTKSLW